MTKVAEGIPPRLKRYRERVADRIREFVGRRDGRLHDMIRYHLGFDEEGGELKGKAIRPSLVLFTTEALSGKPKDALPAAVSLELIHNFSLVHDDIQDDAETRRGRESVQAMWNPDQAINAGDGLKDLSLLALTELGDGSSSEETLRALNALSRYSLRMIQGQVKDLHYADGKDIDMEGYLGMIRDKTCALLQASFHLGAIYSEGCNDESTLIRFGELLGYVYQIRDDWLGIWGEPEESGKSAKSDLIEKKMSFPIVYAVQNGNGTAFSKLKDLYFSQDELGPEEVDEVRLVLEEMDAKEGTNEKAEEFWVEAKEELKKTDLQNWAKSDLEDFGRFLLNRRK